MRFNRYRQFGLRTLVIAIAIICVFSAYFANYFRGERFHRSVNLVSGGSEPAEFAGRLRLAINKLPGHQVTSDAQFEFERNFNVSAFEEMKASATVEKFFCRVQLSDGEAKTFAGFWIYPGKVRKDGRRPIEITIVVLGHESYHQMRVGAFQQHQAEIHKLLFEVYPPIVASDVGQENKARRKVSSSVGQVGTPP